MRFRLCVEVRGLPLFSLPQPMAYLYAVEAELTPVNMADRFRILWLTFRRVKSLGKRRMGGTDFSLTFLSILLRGEKIRSLPHIDKRQTWEQEWDWAFWRSRKDSDSFLQNLWRSLWVKSDPPMNSPSEEFTPLCPVRLYLHLLETLLNMEKVFNVSRQCRVFVTGAPVILNLAESQFSLKIPLLNPTSISSILETRSCFPLMFCCLIKEFQYESVTGKSWNFGSQHSIIPSSPFSSCCWSSRVPQIWSSMERTEWRRTCSEKVGRRRECQGGRKEEDNVRVFLFCASFFGEKVWTLWLVWAPSVCESPWKTMLFSTDVTV